MGLRRGDEPRRVHASVEAGGNFVDTADVYAGGRSEEMLGAFIAERSLRHDIVLATKAGFGAGRGASAGGSGARHLHAALEGSLRRLKTDHVDLYWLHGWDGVTPAAEVLETMTSMVRAGRIRYWGVSNASAWWCAQRAPRRGHARPDDDKRLDGANPFGDSLFTERNWTIVDQLRRIAEEARRSPAQVALAWLLGRPGVASTLKGASRVGS